MTKQQKNIITRTIVIGDIHGCYDELIKLLDDVKYNKNNDRLIFLGDYIDRGEDAYSVIKKIQALQKESKNVIALRGNHEDMLLDAIDAYKWSMERQNWYFNGGGKTEQSFYSRGHNPYEEKEWFESLPYYFEDDKRVYVHAGIDPTKPMNQQNKDTMLWVREDFIYDGRPYDKQVIFGHTPSILMRINSISSTLPYKTNAGHICIDTGCAIGGKLTALLINHNKDDEITFMQVDKMNKETEKGAF